jgi:hypothetical protein
MNRFQAGAAHLAISAAIAFAIFLAIYFLWYPDVLFEFAGGRDLFMLVAAVDVTLGPLITTIVYKQGKRGMKFDLAVIAILQSIALAYGVYVLFESRPVYVAFETDRFELVRANQVAENTLSPSIRIEQRESLPLTGPRLVGTRVPTDADEKFKLAMSGMGGVDIGGYPEYHVPYREQQAQAVARSRPFADLRKFNAAAIAEVDALPAKLGRAEAQIRYLPLRAGKIDLTVLIDARTGEVLRISSLRPWQYD